VVIAELQIEPLLVRAEHATRFGDIDRFPAVTRDIAMLVPETVSHEEIERVIRSGDEPLLAGVRLFDLFSGKGAESLGAGRKSMAYTLTYRDKNRTLTNDEVTVVHNRIRERLKGELGAELRE
jgi:phenylalanyl-tRNA synthetase beta chain